MSSVALVREVIKKGKRDRKAVNLGRGRRPKDVGEGSFYLRYLCPVQNKRVNQHIGYDLKRGPIVIAGDLNSNAVWDYERPNGNHSDVVERLSTLGIVSAYHSHFDELQGNETRPTFYFYRHKQRPFHLDHVFIPKVWMSRLQSVEVGSHESWCGLSDHCPVIVDLSDGATKSNCSCH
jgi:endonuclease/exonuclease/phosphatase family metal-dependent hydrolase